jgi:hypothetical protein
MHLFFSGRRKNYSLVKWFFKYYIEFIQQECIPHSQDEVKVEEDPELLPLKRKLCPRPKVDFQYKEKRGRFYCLHADCVGKNQSTRYLVNNFTFYSPDFILIFKIHFVTNKTE